MIYIVLNCYYLGRKYQKTSSVKHLIIKYHVIKNRLLNLIITKDIYL